MSIILAAGWWGDFIRWLEGHEASALVLAAFLTFLATVILAVVTAFYAGSARRQAKASVRMAEEMRRQRLSVSQPVLVPRPLEVSPQASQHNVRLMVANVGNGPAIQVKRTVSHPSLKAKEHTQEWAVLPVNEERDMSFVLGTPVAAADGVLQVSWLDIHGQQFRFSAPVKTGRSGEVQLGDLTFSVGQLDEASRRATSR